MQSFESVACHLELAILSRKFGITKHMQSSAVEYFSFFQQNSLNPVQAGGCTGFCLVPLQVFALLCQSSLQ